MWNKKRQHLSAALILSFYNQSLLECELICSRCELSRRVQPPSIVFGGFDDSHLFNLTITFHMCPGLDRDLCSPTLFSPR